MELKFDVGVNIAIGLIQFPPMSALFDKPPGSCVSHQNIGSQVEVLSTLCFKMLAIFNYKQKVSKTGASHIQQSNYVAIVLNTNQQKDKSRVSNIFRAIFFFNFPPLQLGSVACTSVACSNAPPTNWVPWSVARPTTNSPCLISGPAQVSNVTVETGEDLSL